MPRIYLFNNLDVTFRYYYLIRYQFVIQFHDITNQIVCIQKLLNQNLYRTEMFAMEYHLVLLHKLGGCSSDISSSYFFYPSEVWSLLSRVSGGEFRIKEIKTNPNPNPNVKPSIIFHNNICVFIMIFTALSFLQLIYSLFFT